MKHSRPFILGAIGLVISLLNVTILTSKAPAQETESQRFFEQGSDELNRQIQDLQQNVQQNNQPKIDLEAPNPQSTLEQKEEALENELQIHQEGPKLETVPSPEESLGLDDNQPFQPENQEIEIKF